MQTAILKTDAVVLRCNPYSETSMVVTWLSHSHGRIVTMLKGAMRPKSAFSGQCDIFHTCELLFYERSSSDIHIAAEVTALNRRPALRENWKAYACASYICDVVSRTALPSPNSHRLFDLLEITLDHLNEAQRLHPLVFFFELKYLEELGMSPLLNSCATCNAAVPAGPAMFSTGKGGILCKACSASEPSATDLPPDIRSILRSWQKASTWQTAVNTHCSSHQLDSIQSILGDFMKYHTDSRLLSRDVAFQTVSMMS